MLKITQLKIKGKWNNKTKLDFLMHKELINNKQQKFKRIINLSTNKNQINKEPKETHLWHMEICQRRKNKLTKKIYCLTNHMIQ